MRLALDDHRLCVDIEALHLRGDDVPLDGHYALVQLTLELGEGPWTHLLFHVVILQELPKPFQRLAKNLVPDSDGCTSSTGSR